MKKLFSCLIAILALTFSSRAQVNAYTFDGSTGSYTPLTTETVLWTGYFDAGCSSEITIPAMTVDNTTYTAMFVTTWGWITLGGTQPAANFYPISMTDGYPVVISAFGTVLTGNVGSYADAKISYNTNVGGEVVVQYQDVQRNGNYSEQFSMQIRLDPSTGKIRFVYGGTITGSNSAAYPQVGLRGPNNTVFHNRTTATDWSSTTKGISNAQTCYTSLTVMPTAGLTYTFTPPTALYAVPLSLDFGYVPFGSSSPEQSFALSGGSLTAGPVTVTAPAGFGVSLTSGGPYTSSVTVSYTPPILPNTNIYCKLTPTEANTNYSGNISSLGGGASKSVAVTGGSDRYYLYCSSAAANPANEDIFNVTVGTLNNSSTCSTLAPGLWSVQNKYSNYYFDVAPPELSRTMQYGFSLTSGRCGGKYANAFKVFIDYYQDGDFNDAGEEVYVSAASTTGPHTETGFFAIPDAAATGNTMMRVICVETSDPSLISPCGSYAYGETEDYRVNITPAPPACGVPPAQPTALILNPAQKTVITGAFSAAAGASHYLVVHSLSPILSATPVNGTVYTAGSAIEGAVVDYFGTSTSFTSTGLLPGTIYYYFVFAANYSGCSPVYLAVDPLTGNQTTIAQGPLLYGLTVSGGDNGGGAIIRYDPADIAMVSDYSFNAGSGNPPISQSGSNPYGSLSIYGGKLYGMTISGGSNGGGVIFEWDPSTNTYTKKIDLSVAGGSNPRGSLTLKDGKLYGMTNSGGTGNGVLFEWDPSTNAYTKKIDLSVAGGGAPYGSLALKDGKFYGMTRSGGASSTGVIFEWDPSANIYTKKIDLTYANGRFPYGSLTLNDGKFYGMTSAGGTDDKGGIFEWDPLTNIYTKKIDLSVANIYVPYGSLTLKDGKFYGMTSQGGDYGAGAVFEWDPSTGYVDSQSFYGSPNGSLTVSGGKFYGMTSAGGSNGVGVIFEWDPANYIPPVEMIDLSPATGSNPKYTQFVVYTPCSNPLIGGTIASGQSGCNPFDPVLLTSSSAPNGYAGTLEFQWQKSTAGSSTGFTDIAGSNSSTCLPGTLTVTTWFRRLARVDCRADWSGAMASNAVQLTVYPDPASVGGSIAGSTAVCSGTNSTTLTLSGQTGSILMWQKSTGDWTNPVDVANTTTTLVAENLTQTTVFRAVVQSGQCAAAYSEVETVAVNPAGQMDQPPDQVVCNGSTASVAFTTINTGGTTSYSWTNDTPSIGLEATGTDDIAPFTATNAGTAPVTATINVTPTFTNGSGSCTGPARTFQITVNPLPVPVITGPEAAVEGAPGMVYITQAGQAGYDWTISPGGIITSGGSAFDHTVTVTWNNAGAQWIDVNYAHIQTGCRGAQPTRYNVTVSPLVPPVREVPDKIISLDQVVCYDATQTIIVAGIGNAFLVQSGGTAHFVAGQNIIFRDGVKVEAGGNMHGNITQDNIFCSNLPLSFIGKNAATGIGELSPAALHGDGRFLVYPNPTDGRFTVEYTGKAPSGSITAEIYGMKGEKILSVEMFGEGRRELTLDGRPAGIYLVRIVTNDATNTVRILKR